MPNLFVASRWRLVSVVALLFVAAMVLVSRLIQLQIVYHDAYLLQARDQHLQSLSLPGRRGAILDRNGYPLAISVDTFDVYLDRRLWQDPATAQRGTEALQSYLGITPAQIEQALAVDAAEVRVAADSPYELGKEIAARKLAGVRLLPSSARAYPGGSLAAPLLGFIGRDKVGLTGLEADYDKVLSGSPGTLLYERDSMGNQIPLGLRRSEPPHVGANLVLTIDRYIQWLAEQELDKAIAANGAKGGAIVVMEPATGAVLAMASRPAFDLRRLDLTNESQVALFRNRVITDLYEPGSVFKVITMAAAVNERLVNPNTTYVDKGVAVVDGWPIYNWDFSTNGVQTTTQILQKSLNTGAVWLSGLLGPNRFYDYVQRFGFASTIGVGLGGEAAGQLRTPESPRWSRVDMATNSFGQGLNVTPLQMTAAVAALANGGKLVRPYVVQVIEGSGVDGTFEPQAVAQVVSPEAARTVVAMMSQVVDGAAWHPAKVPGYKVAGKTGTAWIATDGIYDQRRVIASFVGIVPAEKPRLVVLVKVDEPSGSQWGTDVAAPAFSRLASQALRYLGIPPDDAALVRQSR